MDLWPFGPAQLVIADPDAAAQVTQVRSFPKHKINDTVLRPLVGRDNIVSTNGAEWKAIIKPLTMAFASSNVKNLISVVIDETMIFREHLGRLAETGETFNMEEAAAKLIFDVIGKAMFNFPLYAQTTGSGCLTDLRTVVESAVQERTWNPLKRIPATLRRRAAGRSASKYISGMIRDRYSFLKSNNIIPNKRNASSILDHMLYERLQAASIEKDERKGDLDSEFMESAITTLGLRFSPAYAVLMIT